jgi:glycosyltransferase involved in cell wall biosynthesis
MRLPLSVTVLTKNEEASIGRCLSSLRWADEIVVADSGSTDRTLEICREYHCRILETQWLGYGPTKQQAVDAASNDWILSVDADEEATEELRAAILTTLEDPACNAYRIRRRSFYLGRQIRHCGWNRDYPIRLFHRGRCRWNEKPVHESVTVSGETGRILSPLLHHTYPTVRSHVERMNLYADLGASHMHAQGRSSSIPGAVVRGAAKFLKMYVLQAGFLDGRFGFVLCRNSAFGVYLKYLKLWEQTRSGSSK